MSQTLFLGFPVPVVVAFAALVLVLAALGYVLASLRKPVTIRPPASKQWEALAQDTLAMDEPDEQDAQPASPPARPRRAAQTEAEAEAQSH